jgi:hypothetical protein
MNLPKFPTTCSIWTGLGDTTANWYSYTGPPRLSDVKCELVGRGLSGNVNNFFAQDPTSGYYWITALVCIYFPKGTDVRGTENETEMGDTIVTADGWTLHVIWVIPIAHAFDNEFCCAVCGVIKQEP